MICIVSLVTILFLNPDLLDQEVVLAYFFVILMNTRKGVTLNLWIVSLNLFLLKLSHQIMRKMSSCAVYANSLTFRLKSLMMKLNKSLLKLALRINYVSFLLTLTSIFLMMTNMSLLMISSISCILMYSNGFYPLISKPTRITSHSATLIDNIFSNAWPWQSQI